MPPYSTACSRRILTTQVRALLRFDNMLSCEQATACFRTLLISCAADSRAVTIPRINLALRFQHQKSSSASSASRFVQRRGQRVCIYYAARSKSNCPMPQSRECHDAFVLSIGLSDTDRGLGRKSFRTHQLSNIITTIILPMDDWLSDGCCGSPCVSAKSAVEVRPG